jgi:hypothetical protein
VYCQAEVLTLEELSRYRLPSPRSPNELYRELFSFQHHFENAVRALEADGWVPQRSDGTYRVWDAYRILGALFVHTRIVIPLARPDREAPAGSLFDAPAGWLPDVRWAFPEDDQWWEAVERANQGFGAWWEARHLRQVRDGGTGQLRDETDEEFRSRITPMREVIEGEIGAIAQTLRPEPEYWKERLAQHATLAIELREGHFTSLSRLCSWQLSAAARLAEVRLGRTRREIRSFVERVNRDLTAPALSAASFSIAQRAFDEALDRIEEVLPSFNEAMPLGLRLSIADGEGLLTFLDESGLEDWFTELSIVTWHSEQFWDRTFDQRVGLVYGRVRTLCSLLEEALLPLADETGDPSFRNEVECASTLYPRLTKFVRGPRSKNTLVDIAVIDKLWAENKLVPPFSGAELQRSLIGLGMPSGNPPPPTPAPTLEQVLTGFVFIRNLTSHRYPVLLRGTRVDWFETWGGHLPAINRTILWVALALRGLTNLFSKKRDTSI